MKIGDKMDFDHHPVEVWIKRRVGERSEKKGRVKVIGEFGLKREDRLLVRK